jgi:hypothetical protein
MADFRGSTTTFPRVPKPRLIVYRHVFFHCRICAQNFGDPERLRIPISFAAWIESIRAHVLLNHRAELERVGKSPVNEWLVPLYS